MNLKDEISDRRTLILIVAGILVIYGLAAGSPLYILIALGVIAGLWFAMGDSGSAKKRNERKIYFGVILMLLCVVFVVIGFSSYWLSWLKWVGFGAGILSIVLFKTKEPEEKAAVPAYKSVEHGSASWASNEEINGAGVFQDNEGLWIGGGSFRSKIGHLMTVAGSRQGKGTCQIIPSLLVNPCGSYVVTDPKGENAFITARFQKEAGQHVYILDPWDEQTKMGAKHGIKASGFNPFAFLKNDMSELRDNCELVAMYLVPDNPNVKDPYWNDRARSMIKTLLMHIVTALPEEEHNFWTLYKMLRYSEEDWLTLMFNMRNNKAEHELISIAAEELIGMEKAGNTMAGIKSAAQNATTIFESPQLRKSLATDDFNPYKLADGNCTVYLVIPERFLDTHGVWLRIVVGLCLKACNSRPNKRVSFLLDEFAVLGKMKEVQRGYAFASGQNIVLWTFVQSLAQLKEIYGEEGMNNFISNAAVFQAFGIKDHFTTEYISKMLGDTTAKKIESSFSKGYESYSVTETKHSYARRLLTPDEVETNTGIITIVNGLRVKLEKLPYYRSAFENQNYDKKQLEKLKKYLEEKRAREGFGEWHEAFQQRADPPPHMVS